VYQICDTNGLCTNAQLALWTTTPESRHSTAPGDQNVHTAASSPRSGTGTIRTASRSETYGIREPAISST
jgi:hypothetical protein